MSAAGRRVGLIVNPVAGMGGAVGLKGTDGADTLKKALALGARPGAGEKAALALEQLRPLKERISILTCPGEMGEEAARRAGFEPSLIDWDRPAQPGPAPCIDKQPRKVGAGEKNNGTFQVETGPSDTEKAAAAMAAKGIDLLLFAGGDGTARNICNALGERSTLPVIGIPAGVKIHSAVYAVNPRSAGELSRLFLQEEGLPLRRAEVMDIDEEAFRGGRLSARLYGYLPVPCSGSLMQHLKVGGGETEESALEAIAERVVEMMESDRVYIVGPGSTTVPIMRRLGLEGTLLGVDVVENGSLLAADAGENKILELIEGRPAGIIATVIGGQGYLFGRGNQQISAGVIRQVGRENIIVVATREKMIALEEGRLLADTGDETVNRMLGGYIRVITGYREELIFPLSS